MAELRTTEEIAPALETLTSTPSRIPANFFPPKVSVLAPNSDEPPSLFRTTALIVVLDVPILTCCENAPAALMFCRNVRSESTPTIDNPVLFTEIELIRPGRSY